jgi:opacity protein-like surface antigen
MRSVKFLVAAGAASLLSSMASAADMAIMPAPMYAPPVVEDFGGWYLRGDIGFSNQRVKTRDYYSYPTLLSLEQRNGFDAAGIFGVGVGYKFNNWFRADVTGQYRGNSNFHGLDLTSYSDTGTVQRGSDTYGGSKSEILVLANVYADLGTWWCVTPFIGAGVGMSRNTIANFTDVGANGTLANGTVVGLASATTASKWNLAWALHTGLAYKVSPNMTVELGYSYVNLGDGVTGELVTKDGTGLGQNHVMTFKDITSHDLKLGVRWQLESAPVYAPPLMRKG